MQQKENDNDAFVGREGKTYYLTSDVCPVCGEYLLRTWGEYGWEYTCNRTDCEFGY